MIGEIHNIGVSIERSTAAAAHDKAVQSKRTCALQHILSPCGKLGRGNFRLRHSLTHRESLFSVLTSANTALVKTIRMTETAATVGLISKRMPFHI